MKTLYFFWFAVSTALFLLADSVSTYPGFYREANTIFRFMGFWGMVAFKSAVVVCIFLLVRDFERNKQDLYSGIVFGSLSVSGAIALFINLEWIYVFP